VYVVSLLGVTGMRHQEAAEVKRVRLAECKSVVESLRDAAVKLGAKRDDLPIVVGFGIKARADVEEFGEFADGCVVGSKIVQDITKGGISGMAKGIMELSGGPLKVTVPSIQCKKTTFTAKVRAARTMQHPGVLRGCLTWPSSALSARSWPPYARCE